MSRVKAIDGLPVIDAKRSIKLSVTSNDINKADKKDPAHCAFACAARRELHVKEARVHLGRVYLRTNDNNWIRYLTPRNLRSEIIVFDRGGKFAAGEFTLSAPMPTKRLGKMRGSKTNQNRPGGKKRRAPHVVNDVRTGPA